MRYFRESNRVVETYWPTKLSTTISVHTLIVKYCCVARVWFHTGCTLVVLGSHVRVVCKEHNLARKSCFINEHSRTVGRMHFDEETKTTRKIRHVMSDHPTAVIELSEDERSIRLRQAERTRRLIETFASCTSSGVLEKTLFQDGCSFH
ncbi:hypothetical protein NPIL_671941 [Nephila pilipes]|uniref:Uncharacterized protein n=1 Tax=Nephila pilipes TaxID=299642 RepID=A0A8X6NSC4_NEPPI|nr:hypothetical protein NPIL_671941 [Nephila pilipes]